MRENLEARDHERLCFMESAGLSPQQLDSIAWLLVALLVGSMFAASLPHVANDVFYYEWSVLQARKAAETFFPNYRAFVNYILLLRALAIAVFWISSRILFRDRSRVGT